MRLEGISQREVITVLVELPICDRATCNSQVTRYVVKRVQTLAPEAGAQKWRVQNRMICDRQLTAWMSSGHLDQRRSCPMRLLLEGLYGPGRRAVPPLSCCFYLFQQLCRCPVVVIEEEIFYMTKGVIKEGLHGMMFMLDDTMQAV